MSALQLISTLFLGRIGEMALGAALLGNMLANATGSAVVIGEAHIFRPLCWLRSNNGSGHSMLAGVWSTALPSRWFALPKVHPPHQGRCILTTLSGACLSSRLHAYLYWQSGRRQPLSSAWSVLTQVLLIYRQTGYILPRRSLSSLIIGLAFDARAVAMADV